MYSTYIFAQIRTIDRVWHAQLEKVKTITIYMRLKQKVNKRSFILLQKCSNRYQI